MPKYTGKVLLEFSVDAETYAGAMRKSMDTITMIRDHFSSERAVVPTCPHGVWMEKSTPAKLSVHKMYVKEGDV